MKISVRIGAIVFIFICTSVAWMILGATIFARTDSTDSRLRYQVNANWGTAHMQSPPSASYTRIVTVKSESTEDGKKIVKTTKQPQSVSLPLQGSRMTAGFDLAHRQKGLMWYSTYKVEFDGAYTFRNSSREAQNVKFTFSFPTTQAIYDDLRFEVDGQPVELVNEGETATARARIAGGETAVFRVSFRSQGLGNWRYRFGENITQVRDFELKMTTNFRDVNFPDDTLSPTDKQETADGWALAWTYNNLLSGYQVGLEMPEKLQPGPLAGRISLFAPVSLFFFFFLMFIFTTLREIDLHPMNYFFLAAAFFAFHLLMAYLVDHISIHAAFWIAAFVSVILVVSYLRLAVGLQFALREAGLAQLVYLVLFSYAFFLEGFTGLTITVLSIVTLFVVMQMTGRVRWSEKFKSSAS
jgi:inner membrane protein involved in colicin E2 resistance